MAYQNQPELTGLSILEYYGGVRQSAATACR
jgi:hypothetical protein